jgi:hypothetical protein
MRGRASQPPTSQPPATHLPASQPPSHQPRTSQPAPTHPSRSSAPLCAPAAPAAGWVRLPAAPLLATRSSRRAPPPPRAGSGDGGGGGGGPLSPLDKAALREAGELLQQAQEISELQTRSELMSSLAADEPAAGGGGEAGGEPPPSEQALAGFWLEQGLKRHEAERLARELAARGKPPPPLSRLAAKVSQLARVLPGLDVAQLVYRESGLLFSPAPLLVNNLVVLIQLGFRDVVAMVAKQPGLLLLEDLAGSVGRALDKLVAVHPSRSRRVAADLLEESPGLVARLQYYLDPGVTLEELPIEIQNAMVLGDHGLGFLYRYYKQGGQQAGGHPDRASGFDDGYPPADAQ